MKKIFTILGLFALSVPSIGQHAIQPASPEEVIFANEQVRPGVERSNRGSEFFCEDFSNGLDGSTAFGAWTTGGQNAEVWAMATADSPAGVYSTNLNPMASPSASNGWVIFDADLAQDGIINPNTNPVELMSGWLTTPELNMSELENVKVEFNQYFRYCCSQLSPMFVQVSVDGGATWTSFSATGTLITGANAVSANPLLTVIDVSCIAANQPSVYIRWAYNPTIANGYSHYFWGLDDICIYETDVENDIQITQVTNGNIFTLFEYTITPIEQAIPAANGGLVAGVIFRNNGRQDQTNCQVTVEILNEDASTVLATATAPSFELLAPANEFLCPAPVLDTLFINTGWEPSEIGTYIVRATIESDQEESSPADNTRDRVIRYTTDEYGHDGDGLATGELRGMADPDNPDQFLPFGVGNYFHFPNPGSTVYGLTTIFGPNTDAGSDVLAAFYTDLSTAQGQNFNTEALGYFSISEQWIDSDPIYLPFDNTFSPEGNNEDFHVAAIQVEDNSIFEVTVRAQANSDSDNSTLRWNFNANQQLTWFGRNTFSPAIRVIVSDRSVSVDEENTNSSLEIFPNPASTDIRVDFELQTGSYVAYEIRDINGKLITFDNMGRFPSGKGNININVNEIASGTYILGIVSDGKMIAREKLVVSK